MSQPVRSESRSIPFARAVLLGIAVTALAAGLAGPVSASNARSSETTAHVESATDASPSPGAALDASFLAAHQEEGRDLAGAETELSNEQIALIILAGFAGLLLLILIL
jgi:hypothetical protein